MTTSTLRVFGETARIAVVAGAVGSVALMMTLVVALGSLALYGGLVAPPAGSAPAFVFVAVPPGSWLLMAIVAPIVALTSRRRHPGPPNP